jgi:nucleotide-binding universal stress UspA family protein
MKSRENGSLETDRPDVGTLLYVTDLIHDSNEALDVACELAASHGVHLELIHVVELEHARSSPDGQMGIQFRLDVLAQRLRHLKCNVASRLLFGSPEEVISKRAKEIKAKLIAFAFSGQSAAGVQAEMVKRVGSKVACPVMILPAPAI